MNLYFDKPTLFYGGIYLLIALIFGYLFLKAFYEGKDTSGGQRSLFWQALLVSGAAAILWPLCFVVIGLESVSNIIWAYNIKKSRGAHK